MEMEERGYKETEERTISVMDNQEWQLLRRKEK